jgi:class 3 adenylate cyclase
MRTPPLILIADDNPMNVDVLRARLAAHNYDLITAADGEQALAAAREHRPDLILLDVDMPKMDGLEVCRRLRGDDSVPFIPIIMVTAKADSADVVAGLEAGSDEYLTKPFDGAALVARVKSMLRIKALHDTVQAQTAELTEWNRTLEQRVAAQVSEIERINGLRRFLSPQIAEAILSAGTDKVLESHRREITVAFCDLRGFTAFSETAEPEELMGVLREYHAALGEVIFRFEGTLERFAGDGLMIFFNDPVPCPDPALRAVRMAVEMRTRVTTLADGWKKRGHQLGFGMGIALGFATLGRIGFEGRSDYGAIGAVTNLAARLCGEALTGQILISQRVFAMVEDAADVEPLGELPLKGLSRPVTAYNVLRLKESAA